MPSRHGSHWPSIACGLAGALSETNHSPLQQLILGVLLVNMQHCQMVAFRDRELLPRSITLLGPLLGTIKDMAKSTHRKTRNDYQNLQDNLML